VFSDKIPNIFFVCIVGCAVDIFFEVKSVKSNGIKIFFLTNIKETVKKYSFETEK